MIPTPRTDAYKGTHETHRINGKTIYGHAEEIERELAEARAEIKRLAVAIQAATVLIAAKGRHNTFLAYNGLRAAIAAVEGRPPFPDNHTVTEGPV